MKTKIKIAIYSGELPSTTFIERLIVGLAARGNEIVLFGKIKKKVAYKNASVRQVGFLDTKWNKLFFLAKYSFYLYFFRSKDKKKLDAHIKATDKNKRMSKIKYYPVLWHQPDIFHVQWAKSTSEWMWVQDFGIKLVVSLRGTHSTVSPIADLKLKKSYEATFPKVNGFHAVSKAIGVAAEKYGADSNNIQVVYSGLSLPSNIPLQNSYEKQIQTVQLLSIGRSHWIKGYDYALDTCKLLKEQGIDFHYTIVGAKGVEELEYQKNDLGLNSEVTFLDKLPYEKVLQLMQEAHLIVLPSVEEGIANVILEAMMLQKLVLTTNCGGMEEIVKDGENGFLVPIRNPEAMSEKIIEISRLSKEQIHTITTNARKTIESINSEEKMVADMETLYHFVLEKTITS